MDQERVNRSDKMRTRQCAVTRDTLPVSELIRFVETPDGSIIPDLKANLPGRGVWISCGRDTVEKAMKSGAFARGLKKAVKVDPALSEHLDQLLSKRVLDRLSLANKAGLVTTGFVKVSKSLERGEAVVLLHGEDGAPDGKRKLDAILKKAANAVENEKYLLKTPIDIFSIEELSLAIGRENVVHASIGEGGASESFLSELQRLMIYRGETEILRAA